MKPKFEFDQKVYVFDDEFSFFTGKVTGIYKKDNQFVYTVEYLQGHQGGLPEEEVFTEMDAIVSQCIKNIDREQSMRLDTLHRIIRSSS